MTKIPSLFPTGSFSGRSSLLSLSCGFVLAIGALSARADTTIDTFPDWNGSNYVYAWGGTDTGGESTPTYGQTFTAPSDEYLQSFTFYIQNDSATSIPFQAFVYAWNGTTATGSALFSGPTSSVPGTSDTTFQTIATDTDNLLLTTGDQYVAFLTTVTNPGGVQGNSDWGYLGTASASGADDYPGGNFVFNNGTTADSLTNGSWDNPATFGDTSAGNDTAFTLKFTSNPVPEPNSSVLMALGAASIFGFAFHRGKRNRIQE